MNPLENDIPLSDLAERWHRSPATIIDWCKRGKIGYYKVGGAYWFTPQHLLEYRSKNERRAAPAPEPKKSRRKSKPLKLVCLMGETG